jgi:hypothetical protein
VKLIVNPLAIAIAASFIGLAPAAALPVSSGPAASAAVAPLVIPVQDARSDRDHRRRSQSRRGERHRHGYRAGGHYRHAPRGWHRHRHRPHDWRSRGCVVVGPVWFCP